MKKSVIFMIISILLSGAVFAQGISEQSPQSVNPPADQRPRRTEQAKERPQISEPVTVDGTLKLEKGFVAVESGETVYIVPMLNRYIGFIKDLTEGTRVTVEGRTFRNMMHPSKLTIGGKTYDFPVFGSALAFGNRSNDRNQQKFEPGRGRFGTRQHRFNSMPRRERFDQWRKNAPNREKRFEQGRKSEPGKEKRLEQERKN